jgi:hypothetical protein
MIEQEEGAHALKGNVKVFPCLQANRQLEKTFSLSLSLIFSLSSRQTALMDTQVAPHPLLEIL